MDKQFVYSVMRVLFTKEILGSHSLNGTPCMTDDGPRIIKQWDEKKIQAVYEQYKIRCHAEGINEEERKARSHKGIFYGYLKKLHDTSRKSFIRLLEKSKK